MWQAGATLHRGEWASHHRGLSLRSTGSRRAGSVVVAHGPSCSTACGIFPDQGSNPCPLQWQADSQPLRHQGSPVSWVILKENTGHSPSINIPQEVKFITFIVPYIFMMVNKLVMLMKSTVSFFSQINTILSRQSPPTSPVKMGSNMCKLARFLPCSYFNTALSMYVG